MMAKSTCRSLGHVRCCNDAPMEDYFVYCCYLNTVRDSHIFKFSMCLKMKSRVVGFKNTSLSQNSRSYSLGRTPQCPHLSWQSALNFSVYGSDNKSQLNFNSQRGKYSLKWSTQAKHALYIGTATLVFNVWSLKHSEH